MTRNKPSIIEINGRKYDANTGRLLQESSETSAPAHKQVSSTKMIDGVAAPSRAKNAAQRAVNSSAAVHQKPQRTQKLHPAAVKESAKKIKQASPKLDVTPRAKKVIAKATQLTDTQRAERAKQVGRSERIQKFNVVRSNSQAANPAPVAEEPPVTAEEPQPTITQLAASLASPEAEAPAEPAATPDQTPPEAPEQRRKSVFSRRPKLAYGSLGLVALIVSAGVLTYLNMPSISLRVASQRAGFGAELPGYSPSGYRFSGPVSSAEGFIELRYSSNSDERDYTISQKKSQWDSLSLLNDYVLDNSERYVTFREQGLTIYVYDGTNATWVDGGIWYKLEGNSLLTNEQLLKIASSI